MNILITGAGGFAGYHLINALDISGNNICGIDIVENKNIKLNNAKYLFQQVDLNNKNLLTKTLAFIKPDYVYHLAGLAFVPDSVKNPELAYKINFIATFNLFESIKVLSIKPKILFVSSADVYSVKNISNNKDIKITEENPVEPITPYAASKLCAEILARQYYVANNIPITIVRPFNHTGAFQRPVFAPPAFANKIKDILKYNKEPVIEVGNTKVWRDYTDVRDVVKAYINAIECGNGEIYNICNGKSVEIEYILDYFIKKSGWDIKKKINPSLYREGIDKYVCGSYEKLKRDTGWMPEIKINETLDEIYEKSIAC